MLSLSDAQIQQWLAQMLFPFIRIGALLMASPVWSAKSISLRLRILLAVVLTLLLLPSVPPISSIELLSLAGAVMVAQQILVGVAMGFILQVFMHMFVVGGQIIAVSMGLGFASTNDPVNGVSVTVVSQWYLTLATLLLLAVDGHLFLIKVLAQSFETFPITQGSLSSWQLHQLAHLARDMFEGALILALPAMTAVLLVNMMFGVMSRSSPQMNVFAVGFPITLVLGMAIIWVTLSSFLPLFSNQLDVFWAFMAEWLTTS